MVAVTLLRRWRSATNAAEPPGSFSNNASADGPERSGRVRGKIISPCLDPVEALDALVAAECKRPHARPTSFAGRLPHHVIRKESSACLHDSAVTTD